jgi:hypothetical protein
MRLRGIAVGVAASLIAAALLSADTGAGVRTVRTEIVGSKRLTVARFGVRSNELIVVAHSLTVQARGRIVVAGRIELAPGAALRLQAGTTLLVSGSIGPLAAPAAVRLVSSAARTTGKPPPIELLGRKRLTVTGSVDGLAWAGDARSAGHGDGPPPEPGENIILAVGKDGVVTIKGNVHTANGAPGQVPGQPGGDAGTIIVSGEVIGTAEKLVIASGASLQSGNGGEGYSDLGIGRISDPNPCRASTARNVLRLAATNGGDAGSVKIFARSVVNNGEILVGNGGDGGDAGRAVSAADGGSGQGGGDVHAVAGNGGTGGSLLAAGTDLASTASSGRGGEGGMVAANAGDGGHGCNGGRTFASVGAAGADGTGGKPPRREPEPGTLTISGGGNGGSATDKNHHGGAGGDVDIRLPRNRGLSEFTIVNYASGGSGYHGCDENPKTRGTAGGDAGALTFRLGASTAAVSDSFNGGDGGSGAPPGPGGEGGKVKGQVVAHGSFAHGTEGRNCGPPPPPPTTTSSTPPPPPKSYTCSGKQVTIFDNTNGGLVANGGAPPTFSTHGKAYCVTYIETYHWNSGKGAAPGKLGLKRVAGPAGPAIKTEIGPLQAKASAGQNNAPNVNWYVGIPTTPASVIEGSYTCIDSGAATWSANPQSDGGFCIVYAVPAVGSS